ncbi:MAG: hypothetical protein N2448_04795 [Caloramator sp.]|nr:hypothetical protein [Caloramator sp.]
MAVEKMEMINIIGQMDEVDDVAKNIILSSSVHMMNAITEINQNNFPILKAQDNVDALLDFNYIKQYNSQKNLQEIQRKVEGILDIFEIKRKVKLKYLNDEYDFKDDVNEINNLYEVVREKYERVNRLHEENNDIEKLEQYLRYISHVNINLDEVLDMKYIKMKFGIIPKYNVDKLKKNYENISSIVFKVYSDIDIAVVMAFIPKPVEIEVDRVLMSLNFDELKINVKFKGTPSNWINMLNERKEEIKREIHSIRSELSEIKSKNFKKIEMYYSRLIMEFKIEELKSYIACTNEFFYLTGWIPFFKKRNLMKRLEKNHKNLIVIFKETKDLREGLNPPTCLKNGYLLTPFQSIVKMYGIPSYNELDPTAFVGISYMLLFGAMFGDVGQGLVLFLIGEILNRFKRRPNLGGVLARLGISSTIFGFLYGSVFGYEDIINALVVRPMEDINLMLIAAIVLGIVLLSIGYLYNFVNSYKRKDVENGIFSRNGVVGLSFYWLILYYIAARILNKETFLSSETIIVILIMLLIIMVLKEPLANLVKGIRPLYSESVADYYIEEGFGILETLLSLLSNTLSFIRVGAFAINHVGLFIAFATLAKMMANNVESVATMVLGNIIIIGLEGLIVFIQGLRLEYYELFSKYFSGTGYEYNPCCISSYLDNIKKGLVSKIIKKQNTLVSVE